MTKGEWKFAAWYVLLLIVSTPAQAQYYRNGPSYYSTWSGGGQSDFLRDSQRQMDDQRRSDQQFNRERQMRQQYDNDD